MQRTELCLRGRALLVALQALGGCAQQECRSPPPVPPIHTHARTHLYITAAQGSRKDEPTLRRHRRARQLQTPFKDAQLRALQLERALPSADDEGPVADLKLRGC